MTHGAQEIANPDMDQNIKETRLVTSRSVGDEWLRWVEKFNGNIYHSAEWAETRCSNDSYPLFFHWLDNNDCCVGIGVGIERWSPIPLIGHFFKRLDFESYPAVQGNDIRLTSSMIRQILNFAKENGYNNLSINSYLANVMAPDMDRLGFVTAPRIEFVLDLALSEDEFWERISKNHRRNIKRAMRHDLLFKEECTLDAMRQLKQLLSFSRDRRMQRGEKMDMMLDDAHCEEMGKGCFDRNLGLVFFMTHEKQPVTAAFVTIYAGKAYSVYHGSSYDGFKFGAPALLYWKIFLRCRELGCRELNLGGVPASAVNSESQSNGLYKFKAGFGGQQVMCLSGTAENLQPLRCKLATVARKGLKTWKF